VDPLLEIEDEAMDFSGKTVVLFGAGDAKTHGEHFVSALGKMYEVFKASGASFAGFVPTQGYTFEASLALKEGKFCGLPIDDMNAPEKTQERVQAWIQMLKKELGHE
jgi:flavodoxin I